MLMNKTIEILKQQFTITDVVNKTSNNWFITCDKKDTFSILSYLKLKSGFSHLILLTAVDWIEDNKFQLTYLLNNPTENLELGIRVFIERSVWPEESTMESCHKLWPAIKTYQRELHEMFGIDFPDSPEVNDPLILEYWDTTPPYRKDFDTKKYTEETYFARPGRFTKDPAEFMKDELYPKEGEV